MNNSVEGIKGIGGIMSEVTLYNGIKIPMVGYGSFLSTEKEGKQVILDAFDAGYRYIDTARYYNNEDAIGEALAEKYGKSPAQILLRFLIQRGIPVIPKASKIERMIENKNIFDFEITEDEVSYLSCFSETGWSGEHPDLFED